MLRRCRGIAGVPAALELIEDAGREILVVQRVPGRPLSSLEVGWFQFAQVMLRLIRLVWALARRGVRHNDLRPENVIIAPDGRVHLVDFDQASTGSLAECLLAGLGLPVGGAPVCNGLFAPLRERIQARLSPRLVRALRGRRLRAARTCPLPPLPAGASASLRRLHEAWRIAAGADRLLTGTGDRLLRAGIRWPALAGRAPLGGALARLRHATTYANRRVLELGCNMALLSTFLLKDAERRARRLRSTAIRRSSKRPSAWPRHSACRPQFRAHRLRSRR